MGTHVAHQSHRFRVLNNSMVRPDGTGFPTGCYIIIDPWRTPKRGDYVVAQVDEAAQPVFGVLFDNALEFLNPMTPAIDLHYRPAIVGVVREKVTVR